MEFKEVLQTKNSMPHAAAILRSHTMNPYATSEGTSKYAHRFSGRTSTGHFRSIPDPAAAIGAQGIASQTSADHPEDRSPLTAQLLTVSTLGIGTYLGDADEATMPHTPKQ